MARAQRPPRMARAVVEAARAAEAAEEVEEGARWRVRPRHQAVAEEEAEAEAAASGYHASCATSRWPTAIGIIRCRAAATAARR